MMDIGGTIPEWLIDCEMCGAKESKPQIHEELSDGPWFGTCKNCFGTGLTPQSSQGELLFAILLELKNIKRATRANSPNPNFFDM